MIVDLYKEAFVVEVGKPQAESGLPVPWFATNVWDRVQWAAYIGKCREENALAFGINVEFLPTWRKIRPRLTLTCLEECLSDLLDDEWHWEGRPGFLCKNPETIPLYTHQPVRHINLAQWLSDLDEILEGRLCWRNGRPMRPQLQIMRMVGKNSLSQDFSEVRCNIRRAKEDMSPLMNLLCNRR